MKEKLQEQVEKKVYVKPQVTEVRLVAGEAVLGNCKNAQGGHTSCKGTGDLACHHVTATS